MNILTVAYRFHGLTEIPGVSSNGFISWAHSLCGLSSQEPDSTAWCSSFMNAMAMICGLPRSKSAAARSWLTVGAPVIFVDARPGNDVVVLKRGEGEQPSASVLNAPGHVGAFVGFMGKSVLVLGGNQSDQVSIAAFPAADILGIRRLQ